MTDTTAPPSSIPASGLSKRFVGVVTGPRSTGEEIAPWLAISAVVTAASGA